MSTPHYRVGDRYFNTSANQEYICTVAGDKSSSVWQLISGGGIQQFQLVANGSGDWDNGTTWNCKTWDGTTLGSTIVLVAKPPKLRTSLAVEGIRGSSFNYSYGYDSTYKEYVRTTTGGSGTTDYVTPPALQGDIIYAIASAVALETGCYWQDINADGRHWATKY